MNIEERKSKEFYPFLPEKTAQAIQILNTFSNISKGILKDVAAGKKPKIMVDDEEYDRRITTCNSCEHFRHSDKRCGSIDAKKNWGCGCYISDHFTQAGIKVPGKARFRDAHCPLAPPKW